MDAKNACDHMSGFNVGGRYIIVLYYQAQKAFAQVDRAKKKAEIVAMKTRFGVDGEDHTQKKKSAA